MKVKKFFCSVLTVLLFFFFAFEPGILPAGYTDSDSNADFFFDPSVVADPDSIFAEGMKYFTGDGVSQDISKGCALIYAAANEGSVDAMIQMGYLCAYGFGPAFDKDFLEGSDPVVALNWFYKASDAGALEKVAYSIIEIGYDYLLGRNESIPENTAAAILFFNAAENLGIYNANDTLGIFYTYGAIVSRDPDKALALFLEAAKAGSSECEQLIEEYAYAYYAGTDDMLDINFNTSFRYYNALTDFDNVRAMYNVGLLYYYGLGVSPDRDKGLEWINKSADLGYNPAVEILSILETKQ